MSDCCECGRLREEAALAFSEYLACRDDLRVARKNDKSFVPRRKALEKAQGQLHECMKREEHHREEAHYGYGTPDPSLNIEQRLRRLTEYLELGDADRTQQAVFDLTPGELGLPKVPDEVVEGLLTLLRCEKMYSSPLAGHVLSYFEFEAHRLTTRQKSLCVGFLNAHGDEFTDVLSHQVVAELREGNYLR